MNAPVPASEIVTPTRAVLDTVSGANSTDRSSLPQLTYRNERQPSCGLEPEGPHLGLASTVKVGKRGDGPGLVEPNPGVELLGQDCFAIV